jgi:transketolase N-terminal domain/subunit
VGRKTPLTGIVSHNLVIFVKTNEMKDLSALATQIRRDILRMVHGVNSGHPGGSLGCADFFTALYFKVMKH